MEINQTDTKHPYSLKTLNDVRALMARSSLQDVWRTSAFATLERPTDKEMDLAMKQFNLLVYPKSLSDRQGQVYEYLTFEFLVEGGFVNNGVFDMSKFKQYLEFYKGFKTRGLL